MPRIRSLLADLIFGVRWLFEDGVEKVESAAINFIGVAIQYDPINKWNTIDFSALSSTLSNAAPALVRRVAAAAGVATEAARIDHQHDLEVGVPVIVIPGASLSQGTGSAAALADHQHGLATAVPVAITLGATVSAGSGTAVALANHVHPSTAPTTPPNCTAAVGAAGTSGIFADQNHRHQITVAAPVDIGTTNDAGDGAPLSRHNHVHALVFAVWNAVAATADAAVGLNNQILQNVKQLRFAASGFLGIAVETAVSGDGGTFNIVGQESPSGRGGHIAIIPGSGSPRGSVGIGDEPATNGGETMLFMRDTAAPPSIEPLATSGWACWGENGSGLALSGGGALTTLAPTMTSTSGASLYWHNYSLPLKSVETTGATPQKLISFPMPDATIIRVRAEVVALADGGAGASYEVRRSFTRSGATVAAVGASAPTPDVEEAVALAAADVTIAASGTDVDLTVTGVAATTIIWYGRVEISLLLKS